MKYRLLTNALGVMALLVALGYFFILFKLTGWAGLIGALLGFITLIVFKSLRTWWFKS